MYLWCIIKTKAMTAEELQELGFRRQYEKYESTYHLRIKDIDNNPTGILFIAHWVKKAREYEVYINFDEHTIVFTKERDIKLFIEILERNNIFKYDDYY